MTVPGAPCGLHPRDADHGYLRAGTNRIWRCTACLRRPDVVERLQDAGQGGDLGRTADHFSLHPGAVVGHARERRFLAARHIHTLLLYGRRGCLRETARLLGRDAATVLCSLRKVRGDRGLSQTAEILYSVGTSFTVVQEIGFRLSWQPYGLPRLVEQINYIQAAVSVIVLGGRIQGCELAVIRGLTIIDALPRLQVWLAEVLTGRGYADPTTRLHSAARGAGMDRTETLRGWIA